jgi:hypothetical protein
MLLCRALLFLPGVDFGVAFLPEEEEIGLNVSKLREYY